MVNKKLVVTALGTLGTIIFLAGLFTSIGLGAPHYAFFWALVCWVIAGVLQGTTKKEKKDEEGK